MTYRSTHGLGATLPTLTPENIAYLTKAMVAAGGCTPQVKASMQAVTCLNTQQLQWLGACYVGVTPPGVTDLEFAGSCMALAQCGMFDKLGCPGDADAAMAQVPTCLTPEMSKEFSPIIDYCRANPSFQGTNKTMNAACWAMSRYPDLYQKVLNTPLCAPPAAAPPAAAPPAAAPPPDVTTSPEATAAPITDATDYAMTPGPEQTQQQGMSDTTKYALYGAGALVAIGLGYMFLRKK